MLSDVIFQMLFPINPFELHRTADNFKITEHFPLRASLLLMFSNRRPGESSYVTLVGAGDWELETYRVVDVGHLLVSVFVPTILT